MPAPSGDLCTIQDLGKRYVEVLKSALTGWKFVANCKGNLAFKKEGALDAEGQLVSALFRKFLPRIKHSCSSKIQISEESFAVAYNMGLTIQGKNMDLIKRTLGLFRDLK
jgi:hypothetical protein